MIVLFYLSLMSSYLVAELNVLVIGASPGWWNGNSFDFNQVSSELEKILEGTDRGPINLQTRDFGFKSGYSLMTYFHRGSYNKMNESVWKELRGENETDWDYVILIESSSVIESYYPGFYIQGVSDIGKEVAKGGAETILMMGWPNQSSSSTVDVYKEVVYRTGRTLGYKVAPAGLAWQSLSGTHGSLHPTPNGAYIAAASLYSRIWGESASVSSYAKTSVADQVHQLVLDNIGKKQYEGNFEQPSTVFKMANKKVRSFRLSTKPNSSTENGVAGRGKGIAENNGIDLGGSAIGKINGIFTARTWDKVNGGFPVAARFQYPNPYNNITFYNRITSEASDLRTAHSYSLSGSGHKHLPHALMWGLYIREFPWDKLVYSGHGSYNWQGVAQSYLYTMLTGRCPLEGPEPEKGTREYQQYKALRIGYETAWRMSRMQGRAPGFRVMPSHRERHAIDPLAPETMTVQFVLPPQADVTVNISSDQPWVQISPSTIVAKANDDQTVHEITVSLSEEAGFYRGEHFKINFKTSSEDEICDALTDSWLYEVNSLPVPAYASTEGKRGQTQRVTLKAADPDRKQVMSFIVSEESSNGSVIMRGDDAFYTPNSGFFGHDRFVVVANDGQATGPQTARVDVMVYTDMQYTLNILQAAGGEALPLSENGMTGTFQSVLGTANEPARTGERFFKLPNGINSGTSSQEMRLDAYSKHIDAGIQYFTFGGFCKDFSTSNMELTLEFLNSNRAKVGSSFTTDTVNSSEWTSVEKTVKAPKKARFARLILNGSSATSPVSGMFDDLYVKAVKPVNTAPVVTGSNETSIAVDVTSVIPLTASDIDQDPLTYRIVSPPTKGTIVDYNEKGFPIYRGNPGFKGWDQFSFVANDGQVDSNIAVVKINVRGNELPKVKLITPFDGGGKWDKVRFTLTNGLIAKVEVTDDGAPLNGKLTYRWKKEGGPLPIKFGSPNSKVTTVNWGDFQEGHANISFTAYDGSKKKNKLRGTKVSFEVKVGPEFYDAEKNVADQVDVGGPYEALENQRMQLEGVEFFNDNKPSRGYSVAKWEMVSGPGKAVFDSPFEYRSGVTFDTPGDYVLRLSSDDGYIIAYEDVTVVVKRDGPNEAPVAISEVVETEEETDVAFTLKGWDLDTKAKDLNYTVVTYPSHGELDGQAPNLTYRPYLGYVGYDHLAFITDDGDLASTAANVIFKISPRTIVQNIVAEADAHVRNGKSAGTNFGSAASMNVRNKKKDVRHSFLRFDLNELDVDIKNAKLRLYYNTKLKGGMPQSLKLVENDDWQESVIHFNNAPAPNATTLVSWQPKGNSFVEVDVTEAVLSQSDGKVSFRIEAGRGKTNTSISSREFWNVDQRPTLILTGPAAE